MIDIHCHVLPSIDDGAEDIETSLEMLRIAERDGIKKIIATPHFYRNYYEVPYEEVIKRTEELNKIAVEEGINVKIFPGQEVFLDKYTIQNYKEGIIGGLNNSKYMLLELPFDELPKYAVDTIYELKVLGVIPIIAHPERYEYVIKNPEVLNGLIEEGCLFQINAGSVKGIFGKKVQKTSKLLIENGVCDFLATDAHTIGRRCPELKWVITDMQVELEKKCKSFGDKSRMVLEDVGSKCKHKKIKVKKSIFNVFRR